MFKNSVLAPIFKFLFTPEVDCKHKKCQVITTIKPEHMPFEFRKSVFELSGYGQKALSRQKTIILFFVLYFLYIISKYNTVHVLYKYMWSHPTPHGRPSEKLSHIKCYHSFNVGIAAAL